MLNPEMQAHIPIDLYGKTDILFGNMEEIFRFHNDIFLRDLENCISTPELIGLCFVQRVRYHLIYDFSQICFTNLSFTCQPIWSFENLLARVI